jgi:hypothetical protein
MVSDQSREREWEGYTVAWWSWVVQVEHVTSLRLAPYCDRVMSTSQIRNAIERQSHLGSEQKQMVRGVKTTVVIIFSNGRAKA